MSQRLSLGTGEDEHDEDSFDLEGLTREVLGEEDFGDELIKFLVYNQRLEDLPRGGRRGPSLSGRLQRRSSLTKQESSNTVDTAEVSDSSDDDDIMPDITYKKEGRRRLSLLIDEKIKSKKVDTDEEVPSRLSEKLSLLIDEKIESKSQKESTSV